MLITRRLSLPCLLLFAAAGLAAEDPKPEAILEKFVQATGGRAAYEKVTTEIYSGTFSIAKFGLNGTITSYRSAPNKSYSSIDLGAAGTAEEGSDGDVVWAMNAMEGPRIKQGDERAVAMRNNAFHMETHWRDFYKNLELAGTEDVDGKPCYKMILTPNEGKDETRYFDKSSNLLVKILVPTTTPEGPVTAELVLSDYRDEGGILMPHTIVQKVPTAEVLVKITTVKQNAEIPANRFDLPTEIKALIPKK